MEEAAPKEKIKAKLVFLFVVDALLKLVPKIRAGALSMRGANSEKDGWFSAGIEHTDANNQDNNLKNSGADAKSEIAFRM
jgi:hypothetical protein